MPDAGPLELPQNLNPTPVAIDVHRRQPVFADQPPLIAAWEGEQVVFGVFYWIVSSRKEGEQGLRV